MPYLKIQVNRTVPADKTGELLKLASKKIASELGKPESYVMVELTANTAMLFAGKDDPAVYAELKSIGLPAARHGAL
jgi:phenylpyruvate tautomerase